MVALNKIYTRTGDKGTTGLGTGERRIKYDTRVDAYGTVDEANAAIGIARLSAVTQCPDLDVMLGRVQNDLFDLGADLCTPHQHPKPDYEELRITAAQVVRLEHEIDLMNSQLQPLRSFVLPGGTPTAAHLHLARTITRRAERIIVALSEKEDIGTTAIEYINRLSDFLFVASRYANHQSIGDVLWVPGKNR
jgi:cob(I)alamin adenosyltransferase